MPCHDRPQMRLTAPLSPPPPVSLRCALCRVASEGPPAAARLSIQGVAAAVSVRPCEAPEEGPSLLLPSASAPAGVPVWVVVQLQCPVNPHSTPKGLRGGGCPLPPPPRTSHPH